VLVNLADLSRDIKQSCFHGDTPPPEDRVKAIVEAVKCLCNIIQTNHHLTTPTAALGVLRGLVLRLGLVRNVDLPPDVLTFDLRLLFLMTACGIAERAQFRDEHKGLYLLVNLIDWILFGRDANATSDNVDDGEAVSTATETSDPVVAETETVGETAETDCSQRSLETGELRGSEEIPLFLPPERGSVSILPRPLTEERLGWVAEAMKVVFNQTVHWREEGTFTEDEVTLLTRIVVLVRIILVSVPFQLGKLHMDTVIHSTEVLVNTPFECSEKLLLPREVQIMPTLQSRCPDLFPGPSSRVSGLKYRLNHSNQDTNGTEESVHIILHARTVLGERKGVLIREMSSLKRGIPREGFHCIQRQFKLPSEGASPAADSDSGAVEKWSGEYDEMWEERNMTAVVCLLKLLIHTLDSPSPSLSTILTVLRNISKGSRDIRRFLKAKILPPLREVTRRPEQEDSLKGRLVRLMTAAGGSQGCEGVAAEFLFVLCKEDSARLIKYTGYGNAAGLLLTHGLLGGGRSDSAADYSSDSESDTEDYVHSKPSIDPVTGGPSVERGEREGEREAMTDEEKEREAAKLVEMMRRLNEQGVIRVLPLDSTQQDILSSDDIPLD
jgi:hypothetical protein